MDDDKPTEYTGNRPRYQFIFYLTWQRANYELLMTSDCEINRKSEIDDILAWARSNHTELAHARITGFFQLQNINYSAAELAPDVEFDEIYLSKTWPN